MKYRSKKGTVIELPDGLTPKQLETIKAEADSGYGTRAQEIAKRMAKANAEGKVPQTGGGLTDESAPQPGGGLTPKQQERLAFLKKNRPKDPQIAKLEALQKGAGGGATEEGVVAGDPAFNPDSYLRANPDVAAEAARLRAEGDPRTPQQIASDHYRSNGKAEGRTGAFGDQQSDTVNPDGTINPDAAADRVADAREVDAATQFKLDNPDQTDEFGNTVTYTMGPDGKPIRTVKQGETATRFRELALAAAQGWNPDEDRRRAEEATYGTLTKYYDRDQAREMEEQKQELANRGIPYDPTAAQDPNSKNLYGRTIGGISEKFRGLKDTAAQQSVLSGNAAFQTTTAAKQAYLDGVMKGSNLYGSDFRDYVNTVQAKSGDDTLTLMSMSADQIAKMRGISLAEAEALRNDALEKAKLKEQTRANKAAERLSAQQIAKSGGGGGGGGGDSFTGQEYVVPD
jgi:hypothetical protein